MTRTPPRTEAGVLFECSAPLTPFDVFRVPYRLAADDRAAGPDFERARVGRRSLVWTTASARPAHYRLGEIHIFAALSPDSELERALSCTGDWHRAETITDPDGSAYGSVWRSSGGDVLLPFDPSRAVEALWSEAYTTGAGGLARRLAMRAYYRLRPAIPRRLQLGMRRAYSGIQARATFPRWPLETALHDLCDYVLGLAAEVAGEPLPALAPWPAPYSWAFVLTHDVELALGRDHVHLMRDREASLGLRSSWNFVPRRYDVPDELVKELAEQGFEVGVHGLYHDGRDLESRRMLESRLPAMQDAGRRWSAVGFRSPATHRDWELMRLLGFDYDSSYPDSDPFEPKGGGCCSWLPFFNGELVELPITLPQDHTLFEILGHEDESAWVEKAEALRRRGGMALLITHPDYMIDPARLDLYERFLRRFAADETSWRALPREVSGWWRDRSNTSLERDENGEWRATGPAADRARIVLVPASL
jgi:hypothetical protein